MQPAFERIGAIPGVLGVFTAESGQVRASSLPAIFTSEMLDQIAEPLLGALEKAKALSVDVREVSLSFGDTRAVVIRLTAECLLVVICQESTDAGRLSEFINKLEPEFPAIAAYEPEPEPEAVDLGLIGLQNLDDPAREGALSQEPEPASETSETTVSTSPDDAPASDREEMKTEKESGAATSVATEEPDKTSPQAAIDSPSEKNSDPEKNTVSIEPFVPSAEQKRLFQEALAEFVGPVASLLVNSALRSGATTLEEVLGQLAREIDTEKDRRAFLLRAGGRSDKA